MVISDSYVEYKKQLTDQYQPQLQYRGESVIKNLSCNLGQWTTVWIVWDKESGFECCKVIKSGDSVAISKVVDIIDPFGFNIKGLGFLFDPQVKNWLNLCHYEDNEGVVHYDIYYDRYPIHDDVEKYEYTVGELRTSVSRMISDSFPFRQGDKIILAGRVCQSNLMKALLQEMGCLLIRSDGDAESNENTITSCESAAHINLYVIGTQTFNRVSMPTDKEFVVYEVPEGQENVTVPPVMKLLKSKSDFLGNIWQTAQNADGSSEFCLYSEGIVNYSEKNPSKKK